MGKKDKYETYYEDSEKRIKRTELAVDAYFNSKMRVKDGQLVSDLSPVDISELAKTLNQVDIMKRRILGLPEKWR